MNLQKSWLVMIFFVFQSTYAFDTVVEIIPVYNRPAAELLPILTPLLEDTDRVVANGDSLIVKTLPERVQILTNLVRKLDSPMTNLLISVIQSNDTSAAELNAGLGGQIHLPIGRPSAVQGQIGGYINQYQGNGYQQNLQTLRTLDGQAAHIKAGKAYPITYQAYPYSYGASAWPQSTQYYEATTGFAVTPRLSGQQVTLDVVPWSDRLDNQGQIQLQGAETSIRANLGEWVEIGGVDESSQGVGNSYYGYNNQSGQNRFHILIKVEIAN